jgi:hypothetical protein
MKKTLLFLLSICLLTPAFADERDRAIIVSSANDQVQLEVLSRVGYGFHVTKSPDFKPSVSGEFYFNVLQLDVFPTDWLGLSLGADCAFNRFNGKNAEFYLDEHYRIQAKDYSNASSFPLGTKLSGGLKYFSFNFPLVAHGIIGDLKISAGAELDVNLPGTAYYSYRNDNKTVRVAESKALLNRCSFNVVAGITFCDMGVYFKFTPNFAPLLPAGSVQMNYWTVGIIYGM